MEPGASSGTKKGQKLRKKTKKAEIFGKSMSSRKNPNTKPLKTALTRKRESAIRLANARVPAKKQSDRIIPPELRVNVVSRGNHLGVGAPPGKRLLTRVREVLGERSLVPKRDENGKIMLDGNGHTIFCENTRFDDVADAFVRRMEAGDFPHIKEYIDREEGKSPNVLAILDPDMLKQYVDMPTEGPDAP
jgi:hypothetical protein